MRSFLSVGLALALAAALPPSAQAQPSAGSTRGTPDGNVSLNFVETDIPAVVRAISLFTEQDFLIDPRVKGKITLVSDRPVSRAQALAMLSGSLRLQGFSMVEVGGIMRVVPEADAKLQGSAVSTAGRPASGPVPVADFLRGAAGGQMMTRVFPLRYENAANLVPVLRPMVPPNNPVNAYPGNNTLVVTDYADNLDRIAEVIARIDVPSAISTDVVPLKGGIAADIAALASQLLDTQSNDPTQRVTVVADPRSNSVLVRSGSAGRTRLARELILKLDAQQSVESNLHVVYLRNAQATRIAEVLGGLLTGQASNQAGSAAGAANSASRSVSSAAGGTQAARTQTTAVSSGTSSGGLSGSNERITREEASTQPVSFSAGGATVQADPTSNSLIISAPEPLYRNLRTVIDQLDQRRAQVLVESLIVEVSMDKADEFGIQWMTGAGNINSNGTSFVGGTNLGGSGLGTSSGATSLDLLGNGLSLGVVKGTVDVLGNSVINLGVIARAMQNSGDANILSTPNLLTLDNQSATILVGKTVPFVTGQYVTSGSSGSSNPFQTIEREDVGLKLNIRPQISEGGAVKLDIYQEVSSIDEASSSTAAGVVTNKRAIDTSVLVEDGQIIVLGGLLQDSVTQGTNGVPGLSSIPVLGALFRYDTRKRSKTNLMVFLRPYVVRDAQRAASLTMDRYDYMRRQQAGAQPDAHWLLPDMQGPQIPPMGARGGVSNNLYDARPGSDGQAPRRAPAVATPSAAVRQSPAVYPSLEEQPIRVTAPVSISVAIDPTTLASAAPGEGTVLQLAAVKEQKAADAIARRVLASGLSAYVQPGPDGAGYVVRSQVANDAGTVQTATTLLREMGYPAQVVSRL
ncbi:type II secretion system secretin GspD [Bordetella genomosp. 12]|uniref:Type II secretion system protein GspD n=1 Tax=Bordetella genomosp. 12 TaxID=463035 RepID=A0A261VGS3_9BORD|nr:type II secretion system secretin GspD [Bordetella genomosp. 12]OZI72363.1 type II secretion system protein GspD [Bordetella genomosp. 12]